MCVTVSRGLPEVPSKLHKITIFQIIQNTITELSETVAANFQKICSPRKHATLSSMVISKTRRCAFGEQRRQPRASGQRSQPRDPLAVAIVVVPHVHRGVDVSRAVQVWVHLRDFFSIGISPCNHWSHSRAFPGTECLHFIVSSVRISVLAHHGNIFHEETVRGGDLAPDVATYFFSFPHLPLTHARAYGQEMISWIPSFASAGGNSN